MQVTRPNEIRRPGVRLHPKACAALGLEAERATPKQQRWRTTKKIKTGTAEGKGHEQPQPPNPEPQAAAWRSRPAGRART